MPDPVKRKRWAPGWSDMEFPDGTTVPYYDPEDAELGGTTTAEEVNAFYGAPVAEDYGPPLPPPQEPAGFGEAIVSKGKRALGDVYAAAQNLSPMGVAGGRWGSGEDMARKLAPEELAPGGAYSPEQRAREEAMPFGQGLATDIIAGAPSALMGGAGEVADVRSAQEEARRGGMGPVGQAASGVLAAAPVIAGPMAARAVRGIRNLTREAAEGMMSRMAEDLAGANPQRARRNLDTLLALQERFPDRFEGLGHLENRIPDNETRGLVERFNREQDSISGAVESIDDPIVTSDPAVAAVRDYMAARVPRAMDASKVVEVADAMKEVFGGVPDPALLDEAFGLKVIPSVSVEINAYEMFDGKKQVGFTTSFRLPGTRDKPATMSRYYERTKDGLVVDHSMLILPDSFQGAGLGMKILDSQLGAYEKMGVAQVKIGTAIDVGQYIWPKLGFEPKPEALAQAKSEFAGYLQQQGLSEAEALQEAGALGSLQQLADHPRGKDFLLNVDGVWSIDLTLDRGSPAWQEARERVRLYAQRENTQFSPELRKLLRDVTMTLVPAAGVGAAAYGAPEEQ